MKQPGAWTDAEIHSQPDAWRDTLQVLRRHHMELRTMVQQGGYEQVIFTGCGSPYYLGVAAAATLQRVVGVAAAAIPASEIWLNPTSVVPAGRRLLVALSRSGETTETLRAVARWRDESMGDVLTLSAYPEATLPTLGTLNVLFPAAQEESMAQTRAFTVLHLASVALGALWMDNKALWEELQQLPDALARILGRYDEQLTALGGDLALERFYFLGSGLRYGLACEASLKMKEMTLSHSEPFHVLEYRHGPKSMVNDATLVMNFRSPVLGTHEEAVLAEVRAMGGRTLTAGESGCDISFDSGLGEVAASVLCLPAAQLVALARARAKGLDPDSPANLSPFVLLDEA
jgi:glucosamine--fructose-6-phosphate aminotransferase (isomerizing)